MTGFQGRLARRRFLELLAALLTVGLGVSSAQAQGLPIRAIQVTGQANRDLKMLAPVVQHQLAEQLGARFVPGARGGATLVVNLTSVDFPVDTDGGDLFSFNGDVDVLTGTIRLIGPGSRTIAAFPLQAQSGSVNASDEYQAPTPARLNSIAYTYAHWVISKL